MKELWQRSHDLFMIQLWRGKKDTFYQALQTLIISRSDDRIPSAFIVTGPNISSQGFLFNQISAKLREEVQGPVVVLRSGDATNLKSVLKILIRAATNQLTDDEGLSRNFDVRTWPCM